MKRHIIGLAQVAAVALLPAPALAQFKYQEPPAPIGQILDAGRVPSVSVSPDRAWLLIEQPAGLESIAQVSAPFLGLAGFRVDPKTNGPHSGYATYLGTFKSLRLRSVNGTDERAIEGLAAGDRIRNVIWSPDSKTIAF